MTTYYPTGAPFGSTHPYADNTDDTYIYVASGSPPATQVTFGALTDVEEDYDFLYVMDGAGTVLHTFTGTQAAGRAVTVPGDTIQIRITSDSSVTAYGFEVTAAAGVTSLSPDTAVDTFSRTVSAHWSGDWDLFGAEETYFSVDGSQGIIHDPADLASNLQIGRYTTQPPNDAPTSIEVKWGQFASNDDKTGMILLNRWQSSTERAYVLYVQPTGILSGLHLYRSNAFVNYTSPLQTASVPSMSAGTWYRLHLHCIGTSPTTIFGALTDSSGTILSAVALSDNDALFQAYARVGAGRDFQAFAATYPAYFDNLRWPVAVVGGWRLQVI